MLIDLIIKIANKKSNDRQMQRELIGRYSSYVGIIINVFLSCIKIISGLIFNSISILADGINNLADAGNSLIVFISFKLSNKEADEKHPYGHERIEYLASLAVAISILFLSLEMFKTSISKIFKPSNIIFSYILIIVLIVSILGKILLYVFYKKGSIVINSVVLEASAKDSLSDVFSTLAVLGSTIIYKLFDINLDAYIGLIVAFLILKGGLSIIIESVNKILGEAPSHEYVNDIESKIRSYDGVYDLHDLIIHSYGQTRSFISVHVEVDSRIGVLESHELIDKIEKDFLKENINIVIHLDPIILDNPVLNMIKEEIIHTVEELSDDLEIHDFRAIMGNTHSKLMFDCVIPYSCNISQKEIEDYLKEKLLNKNHTYECVINFERPYNG